MSGGIFFWIAIGLGALLVLGAIGLVIYMLGAGREEEPENLVQVMERGTQVDEEETSEEVPESVFSMPGVKTVEMNSDRRASASTAPQQKIPSRRARREQHSAPTVARNSAPVTKESYEDADDFIPTAIRKPKQKAFSWEDEE